MHHPRNGIMKEFNPYLYKAKITKVYDGDTCTAIIDFGFHIQQKMRLRLAEIDAPEIRGKERPKGLKARDFLRDLILNKDVVVETVKDKKGKYGRYVAKLWVEDICVNDHLVKSGHAKYRKY